MIITQISTISITMMIGTIDDIITNITNKSNYIKEIIRK